MYQKERYGNITYTFPSLVSGLSYNVRLHFAEIYWTASARRRFNVAINGSQVLANFDIYATAGAGKKAVVREFTATANASGQIVVAFTTVTDNASVCGIEIFPNPAQTFTITYNSNGGSGTAPVDANSYAYGSSVTIKPNSGALVSGSSSFAGWNTSGGITYACGQTITITGNLQLNAKYSENEVMDNDGNLYTSVVVGGIEWLLQNLKTTKYRNGSSIPFVTNGAEWATKVESGLPDVCAWPGFSSSNQNFGLLYNWAAVQMGEVAPAGWRIPTEAEWAVLQTVASYPGSTCDLLKDWPGNCAGGQNASGYSLLESGDIYQTSAGEQAYWSNSGAKIWGATNVAKSGPAYARFQGVPGGVSFAVQYDSGTFPFLANGFGVRCVKENPAPAFRIDTDVHDALMQPAAHVGQGSKISVKFKTI